jgi:hypothetical protein
MLPSPCACNDVSATGEKFDAQPARRRQTHFGCSKCKVNICSWECFQAFDHINRCSTRELVVQFGSVVPDSVVGPEVVDVCIP